MPKIKGWKKVYEDKIIIDFINEIPPWKIESRGGISCVRIIRSYNPETSKDFWSVKLEGKSNKYYSFKTKKQALKFAINWMRKHPKG